MIINIADNKVSIDGVVYVKSSAKKSLADAFAKHAGAKEYEGIVSTIQKWYYGSLVKASWCATSLSYFMNSLGLLNQIGGKNENVKLMMDSCKKAASEGEGLFFSKNEINGTIQKDDILFFLWSGSKMDTTSSKHVAVCSKDTPVSAGYIPSIGGNQKDSICEVNYETSKLYALYRYKG